MCIVEAVKVDTEIVPLLSVLPANVENPMNPPLTIVDPIMEEITSVLP
jgi:hypothetical protein